MWVTSLYLEPRLLKPTLDQRVYVVPHVSRALPIFLQSPPCTLKLLKTSTNIFVTPHTNGVHVLILKYPALYTAPSTSPAILPANSASTPPTTRYTSGTIHTHSSVSLTVGPTTVIGFGFGTLLDECAWRRDWRAVRARRRWRDAAEWICIITAQAEVRPCTRP